MKKSKRFLVILCALAISLSCAFCMTACGNILNTEDSTSSQRIVKVV